MVTLFTFHSPQEELQQIAKWLREEGLSPDLPKESQLCLLWGAFQRTRSRLSRVTWDLEKQRSQHSSELTEVQVIVVAILGNVEKKSTVSEGRTLKVLNKFFIHLFVRYESPWSRSESLQSTKTFWLRRYKMKMTSSRTNSGV